MAGISKRVSGAWVSGDERIMKTATDIITTLPAVLYPNDTSIAVGLKGQSSQSGTPTPQNPVDVLGTGERTGNLLDLTTLGSTNATVTPIPAGVNLSGKYYARSLMKLEPNKAHTMKWVQETISGTADTAWRIQYTDNTYSSFAANGRTLTPSKETLGVLIYVTQSDTTASVNFTNIMLNSGSTALPYEPYGYKIPISSANTTTPVYLGEVQSTRQIKKLVLTGDETWYSSGAYTGAVYAYHSQFPGIKPLTPIFCTHLVDAYGSQYVQGTCNNDSNSVGMWVFDTVTSPSAFKAYLAQQYAAGTPVTVWYVLTTPQTAVVNEPLMKIGDYADSLSGISITPTAGANTLDVDTTVKPSEVTASFNGWHPVTGVHERSGGAWT